MVQKCIRERRTKRRYNHQHNPNGRIYFVGGIYKGVYFTRREAQVLFHLLKGKTIPEVAQKLSLSPRTIEFYVKNMRLKLGAYSKDELIEKIKNTDIVEKLDFEGG